MRMSLSLKKLHEFIRIIFLVYSLPMHHILEIEASTISMAIVIAMVIQTPYERHHLKRSHINQEMDVVCKNYEISQTKNF